MAFASSQISSSPKTYSVGPYKQEVWNITCISGDTSGVVTAKSLSRVDFATVSFSGVTLTAAPTISGKAVTLAFADPVASCFGTITLYGR